MNLLRDMFHLTAGVLLTIFYREGMQVAMNWTFVIWTIVAAYDLTMWLSDGKHSFIKDIINDFFADEDTKKGTSRH